MRILKTLLKSILIISLLVVLAGIIAVVTLQSEKGQAWALSKAVTFLESQMQTKIEADKVEFHSPLSLRIQGITFSEDSHVLAKVKQLDISFAYWHLLEGKFIFSLLQANGIDILKLPKPSPQTANNMKIEWGTSIAPIYLKIENLLLNEVRLDSNVIAQLSLPSYLADLAAHSTFNLKGSVGSNPFKNKLYAQLLLTSRDLNNQQPPIFLELNIQNYQLAFSLHSTQFPYTFVSANKPIHFHTTLAFFSSASLPAWKKALTTGLTGEESIEGQFKFTSYFDDQDSLPSILLGKEASFRAKYAWKASHLFQIREAYFDSPFVKLEGEGIVDENQIHENYFEGQLDHLDHLSSLFSIPLDGQLAVKGHFKGHFPQPILIIQGMSESLTIQKQTFQNIQSTLKIPLDQEKSEGSVNFIFEYQKQPCHLATLFHIDSDSFSLSSIHMHALHSDLKGDLSFYRQQNVWEGQLQAHLGNFGDFTPFFNLPYALGGEAQLNAYFKPLRSTSTRNLQGIDLELTGQSIHWKDLQANQLKMSIHLDPIDTLQQSFHVISHLKGEKVKWEDKYIDEVTLSLTNQVNFSTHTFIDFAGRLDMQKITWNKGEATHASLEAALPNPFQVWEGHVKLSMEELKTADLRVDELIGETTLHSSQDQWPFRLYGKGTLKENWMVKTEGFWHKQNNVNTISLNLLEGVWGKLPFALLEPMQIAHQEDKTEIKHLLAVVGDAKIFGEYIQDRQNVFCQFETDEVSTELIHLALPNLPLNGKASFKGYLEGPMQNPQGHLQILLHHMQITESSLVNRPSIDGSIDFNIGHSAIQVQSTLNGLGSKPILANGTLPFTLSLDPLGLKDSETTPFSIAVEAEGNIDPYMQLFYNDNMNLTGQAKMAVNVSGQINAPRIQGTIDFYNGTYESLGTGAIYHNIQAHLIGEGSQLNLKQFSAQDNKQGSITAYGSVEMDKTKQFPFEFHIDPKDIFIVESDYANMSASGPLVLKGTLKQAKLQGELVVNTAIIHMEEALPKQIKSVDIKYINLPEGATPPNQLETQRSRSPVELDIKLHLPNKVIIEGKHLSSEWKGDITVTGTTDNPLLNGDLRITKGEFNFNGKSFSLAQGNIHFAGAPSKKTSLYIVASKEIDRIKAEIIVKGPTSKPVVSFRSNPPLSQREILSYILFNRGIADITSDQGDQLSQSFISLSEGEQTSSSDDFLTRLRNNTGIDRLDIMSGDGENKDISLQAGKHITENIFISINKGISDIGPRVAIEANLRKNLKAQAEVEIGSDTQGKFSLKWKKDY